MNKGEAIEKIEELKEYVSQCDNKIVEYYYGGLWHAAITSVEKIELEGATLGNIYVEQFNAVGKLYCYLGLIFQVREEPQEEEAYFTMHLLGGEVISYPSAYNPKEEVVGTMQLVAGPGDEWDILGAESGMSPREEVLFDNSSVRVTKYCGTITCVYLKGDLNKDLQGVAQ